MLTVFTPHARTLSSKTQAHLTFPVQIPAGQYWITLAANDAGELVRVSLASEAGKLEADAGAPGKAKRTPAMTAQTSAAPSEPAPNTTLEQAKAQLLEYFAGRRRAFSLPLAPERVSGFHLQVLTELSRVPYGQTVSYGQLAHRIGRTGAARAVGGACASNPLPLIIPCHRVVRADGNLGGYLGTSPAMLAFKAYLLQLESNQAAARVD